MIYVSECLLTSLFGPKNNDVNRNRIEIVETSPPIVTVIHIAETHVFQHELDPCSPVAFYTHHSILVVDSNELDIDHFGFVIQQDSQYLTGLLK